MKTTVATHINFEQESFGQPFCHKRPAIERQKPWSRKWECRWFCCRHPWIWPLVFQRRNSKFWSGRHTDDTKL